MKNIGKKFEEDFKKSVDLLIKDEDGSNNFWIYRFKDGTASWDRGEKTRFQANNICDFLLVVSNSVILLELKSYGGMSIPFSGIRRNQLEQMVAANKHKIVQAYFLFNFRQVQKLYALQVDKVQDFINNAERKSIPLKFCIENGTEIKGEIKRTRVRYNVKEWIEQC